MTLFTLVACQPRETVECIAPANPGGGWDLTCRSLGRVLQELEMIEGRLKVTNMAGAGGGVAYAYVANERAGDERLIVAASTGTTLRLAQGQYGELKAEDVHWLGAISAEYGMIAVAESSPFQTLDDVVDAWRKDPSSAVIGGGSAVGGQDHMMSLLVAKTAGIDPLTLRYVSFDGGGEALAAVLGGHVHVLSGDATSNAGQIAAGNIRPLAILGPERMPGSMSGIPTARELGYDVDWLIFRGFYAPADISPEAAAYWQELLQKVEQSDVWASSRIQYDLQPYSLFGASFESLVEQQINELRQISQELGLTKDL